MNKQNDGSKHGNQNQITISFYDWCIGNDHQDYLDAWDYERNKIDPKNIGYQSNSKYWFICKNKKHERFQRYLYTITRNNNTYFCPSCNSIGQFIIDNFGMEYLKSIWSNKNIKSYFQFSKGSSAKVWIKCKNNMEHPDYEQSCNVLSNGIGCPYCIGRKVYHKNSLGYLYPESIKYWSDKNVKTPFDYTINSHVKVWWKCQNGKHEDYLRKINGATRYNFRCEKCSDEAVDHTGKNSFFWKGGISGQNDIIRHRLEYKQWRTQCYELDNYTCQCCGRHSIKLRCHHLNSFALYEDLRLDVMNGITLCEDCHDSIKSGSFHNLYGTNDNTPEQLEEYINEERHEMGINIHFNIKKYINNKIKLIKKEKKKWQT